MKTVLFLCTGNYYRSRFAEELFNDRAERSGIDWIAHSRGLALERGANNIGFISPFALRALKELEITARGTNRFPLQCAAADLASADFVVAVKEAEHRPLMRERFAQWEHVPNYWNVHDVEDAPPAEALTLLGRHRALTLRCDTTPGLRVDASHAWTDARTFSAATAAGPEHKVHPQVLYHACG
jgi:protein-tyrosine phosphatase